MPFRNDPGGWRRLASRASWAALLALALAPSAASARPYRSQFELSRGLADPSDRVGIFVDWTASSTAYDAQFTIDDNFGTTTSNFTYKASGFGTTTMVPRVGVTWAWSEQLLVEGSVGISSYSFQERVVNVSNFGNEQAVLGQKNLNAGLALEGGALYTLGRYGDFQATMGTRLAYRSSSKSSGDDVSGTIKTSGAPTQTVTFVQADEISMRTVAATVSLGAEWRPRNSWLVNDFGIAAAYAYTFGSIKHSVSQGGVKTTSNVDVSMTPSQYLGLYYGWSYFWPRVGVFGLEGQFLAEPRVTLTYEYIF